MFSSPRGAERTEYFALPLLELLQARSEGFWQVFRDECFEWQHKALLTRPGCTDTGAFLLINDAF